MSLLGNANEPGSLGLKKPGGLSRWARSSMPFFATPALFRPGDNPTRGSVVLGSCAAADALIASVNASAATSVPTPFPMEPSSGGLAPCATLHARHANSHGFLMCYLHRRPGRDARGLRRRLR